MKSRQNYSPYSIGIYTRCPKQYYFEYLDNYTSTYPNKQKLKQIQVEAGNRKELVFGGLLHNILNIFFHLPESERTKDKMMTIFKETRTRNEGARGKQGGLPDVEEERQWYQEAANILKNFCQNQNLSPFVAYLPEIEKEDEFIKANLLKAPIREDVTLTGKIDRIDKEKEGYHLIDYKTSKSEREDELQLMAYSILAEEALGMKLAKASYLYLRSGNLKSFNPIDKTKAETKKKLLEKAERIRTDKEFSPRPTKICCWCNYIEFCPVKEEAKKIISEYKGEEPEELPF